MSALECFHKHLKAPKSAKKHQQHQKAPKSSKKHQKAPKSTIKEKSMCYVLPWQSREKQGKQSALLLFAKKVSIL